MDAAWCLKKKIKDFVHAPFGFFVTYLQKVFKNKWPTDFLSHKKK